MTIFHWDAWVKQQQQEPLYSPPFIAINKDDARVSVWLLAALVEWQAALSAGGNLLSF